MPDYECPNCGGGFPENPDKECPWCSQSIDGSYGELKIGFDGRETLKEKINNSTTNRDFSPARAGVKECPECERDMPLVSWIGPEPVCRDCRGDDDYHWLAGSTATMDSIGGDLE